MRKKKKTIKKSPTQKFSLPGRQAGKKMKFQAPRGTFDILPEEQKYWERIRAMVKQIATAYGFLRIDTPIFEDIQLFMRGTGLFTDIVQKEMYTLRTKGGDYLALRPEFTPGIVRAYIEHGMKSWPQPVKLFSIGPLFRHEKPQAGRFRQFHQFNLEIIGEGGALNDVLLIQLVFLIFKKLGIKGFALQINSIGCSSCRPDYRKLLIDYYRKQRRKLCRHCRERLKLNPLRLLDCKEEKCRQLANNAPQVIDHLCEDCHAHFKEVLESLDELGIPYMLNSHLVRGLDYYTKTVFEFRLEGENPIELAGGGRYDGLVELLGGKLTPAVGVAGGIERAISALKSQDVKVGQESSPRIFLVQLGELSRRRSLKLFEELRNKGLKVAEALGKGSIKSQLKVADKLGVDLALILGQKEALENSIIIRDMKSGAQETVPIERVIKEIKRRLK
jgi:histidyl-tRNA synthetase